MDQLPLNFSQTFLPDRRLLGQLLRFAASNGRGDKEAIGSETGIPTGKSTGKVEPMIHYARGMGLITAERERGEWQLGATALGAEVLREDAFFSEPLTLWLLHLLLCRRSGLEEPARGIADPWFALFAEGRYSLGAEFTEAALHRVLVQRHGEKGYLKGLSTLVPRMYLERASFGGAGILTETTAADGGARLRCAAAPLDETLFPAYALVLWLLWDGLFAAERQLAFDELARATRLLNLLGWGQEPAAQWLDWMATQGWLQLDRHTGAALLMRLQETDAVIAALYSELV
mgnify:FL=1